ncbi:CatA-like O-acetyltransferase [Aureivirga sp. CE67]|uniref:CatA-like O-acetyltransferase n=1 Tax=Aureivirga sp. CE67 TaxID=1788983 RepID=UPI0018C9846A|nr:CatA-like O-acetyltransferase [Aureivirga sp. CE67]
MKIINQDNWKRKEYFDFFKGTTNPRIGVTVEMDITNGYQFCKDHKKSLHHFYHYNAHKAMHSVEELTYRIKGEDVVVYDELDIVTVLLHENKTFKLARCEFSEEFETFSNNANKQFDKALKQKTMGMEVLTPNHDYVLYSTVPKLKFIGLRFSLFDPQVTFPKVAFGKFYKDGNKVLMPFHIEVHHGLADGYHVGVYLENYQKMLDQTTF